MDSAAVPRQLARADFAAIDDALRIDRHAFRGTGAFHFERIWNAVEHAAVGEIADADAAFLARMGCDAVRFRIGNVDQTIADRDAARPDGRGATCFPPEDCFY